ncbi:isochorismatase family protein [Streptomyces sp. NPDC020883]|uniref:isochorismatase family protein n=1 Tax=Streptomyces sp. NPDC020883 TaxID=3365099 RepID=UPI003793F373
MLRDLGRDTVIVTGTLTNYCCGTTARQAYERGCEVVFGSDVTFALVLTAEEIAKRLAAAGSVSERGPAPRYD